MYIKLIEFSLSLLKLVSGFNLTLHSTQYKLFSQKLLIILTKYFLNKCIAQAHWNMQNSVNL